MKFLLNESVPPVTDEDDLDMQEKEIREVQEPNIFQKIKKWMEPDLDADPDDDMGVIDYLDPSTDAGNSRDRNRKVKEVSGEGGPAGGGMGDDSDIEPASPDVIEEADTFGDYLGKKGEFAPKKDKEEPDEDKIEEEDEERQAKLVLGKQDTSLYGMSKTKAREILKKRGHSDSEIKGIERHRETLINNKLKEGGMEFPGAEHGEGLDNNMFDGSFFGSDKGNLGDLQHGFDPNNPQMEPLIGQEKPYESEMNTSPQSYEAHGPKGYKNSIPSYNNRSIGFAEADKIPYMYPKREDKRFGKKRSPDCECTTNSTCEACLKDPQPNIGYDPNTKQPPKKESINITKLIRLAVTRGYSKAAIKEMIAVMECKECGDTKHKPEEDEKKVEPPKKKRVPLSRRKSPFMAGDYYFDRDDH